MVTHVGGLHLAQVRIAQRIAEKVGDTQFVQQCQEWLDAGSRSFESKLWNDSYYLSYWEPETSKKCDQIFAFQLDGQWITEFHGLPGVFQSDRVKTTLARLSKPDHEILVLRHLEQLSISECAAVLEISQQAAKKRYVRAMVRLRRLLDDEPTEQTR